MEGLYIVSITVASTGRSQVRMVATTKEGARKAAWAFLDRVFNHNHRFKPLWLLDETHEPKLSWREYNEYLEQAIDHDMMFINYRGFDGDGVIDELV